jgi:hypothetical protein
VAVVCVHLLIACDEAKLPAIDWEGVHVRFATTYDHLPCGRTLERLDQRAGWLQEDLASPLPDGKKITYYWLRPEDMGLSPCGEMHSCTNGKRTVFSTTPFHHHELTHAVASTLGRSHALLEEGLATAFEEHSILIQPYCPGEIAPCQEGVDRIVEDFQKAIEDRHDLHYLFAGHWVRFLIETYGLTSVKAIYEAVSLEADYSEVQSAFDQHVGMSVEETLDQWLADAPPCYPGMYNTRYDALEPADGPDGPVWEHHIELRCDSPTVTEQRLNSELWSHVNIDIGQAGQYYLEADASSETELRAWLSDCSNCDWPMTDVAVPFGTQTEFTLTDTNYCLFIWETKWDDITGIDTVVDVTISAIP